MTHLYSGPKNDNPSLTTLYTCSTRNQRSHCDPIAAVILYCISQLCVVFHGPATLVDPSITTLPSPSTRKQRCNFGPIVDVFLDRFHQLCVFFRCPFTLRPVDVGVQTPQPSLTTLVIRSTRNHGGNCDPLLSLFLYRFSQFCVFFHCPFACVDVGVQTLDPSLTTLHICSARNQGGNCGPITNTVFLYRFSHPCVIFHCPFTLFIHMCGHRGAGGIHIDDPSLSTLCICSARKHRSHCEPIFAELFSASINIASSFSVHLR
jgi:hypothetical protein